MPHAVPPRKVPNATRRSREYLTPREVDVLIAAATVRKIVVRTGEAGHLGFPVHPHMLRRATGFKLANDGHDTRIIQHYLGHKNIQYTAGYTVLAAKRFQGLWPD